MNESLARVLSTLSDPTAPGPTDTDVEALAQEYPFFVLPAILALRKKGSELPPQLREKLMSIVALNSPDPQAMFMLADIAYDDWINFYPSVSTKVSTDDAITKFLETYGHSNPREEALLERLIFNPTPDYSSILAMEEEHSTPVPSADPDDTSQDALINSFILKHKDNESSLLPHTEEPDGNLKEDTPTHEEPAIEHHAPSPASNPAFDSSLSESLAKIYIRQKRYDKAFEIIHALSLNNPKKSAYFADQLRFLRKLIINRENANNSK